MKIAVLVTSIALAYTIGATASPWDKKTILDVKETILIPGKQLPPGKYVMKLVESPSDRHIVQIFNADETKVEATILAIPNMRLKPTGDTALGYWETPAGVPPALRSWFYPGDNFGQEFAYPRVMAERIAATNHTKVPWYEGTETATYEASTLQGKDVHDFDADNAPAPSTLPAATEPTVTAQQTQTVEPQQEQAATTPDVKPAEPVQMAQNNPPVEPPAAAPAQDENRTPKNLPQTATPYGALLLLGVGLVLAGRLLASPRL
ncbi:MAG: hypothetical protein ABI972_23345, partial [Acidobacteriota bacterium]